MHSPDYESYVITLPQDDSISKNIFQICLRGKGESSEEILKTLPKDFHENIAYLKRNNPGWTYHLIGDAEAEAFIDTVYGKEIKRAYDRISSEHGSAKADLLKSLYLYGKGGVYLDLKSTLSKKCTDIIRPNDVFLVIWWDDGKRHYLIPQHIEKGEIPMGIMIGAKGNSFSRAAIIETLKRIDLYNPYRDGIGWEGVQRTTGPAMYTHVVYDSIHSNQCPPSPYREVLANRDCGYVLSFQKSNHYKPGEYQKETGMHDYRKLTCPVISGRSLILHAANALYLKLICKKC